MQQVHFQLHTMSSRLLLKAVQFLSLLLVVRCHIAIIRLIVLATLGLGGLVLLQAAMSGKPISHLQTAVGKRSISDWSSLSNDLPSLQSALDLDDRECARQYICELAVKGETSVGDFDNMRVVTDEDLRALHVFRFAAQLGSSSSDSTICHHTYKKCPYRNVDQMRAMIDRYNNIH